MTNFWYPNAIDRIGRGLLDLSSSDLRVILVLVGTTTGLDNVNRDAVFVDDFQVLFEHTVAGRMALTGEAFTKDTALNRSVLTADPTTWNPLPLATGGEDVQAALLYDHVTDDTDSFPVAYFDEGGYPVTPTGLTRHTINWHLTQGALLLRTAD